MKKILNWCYCHITARKPRLLVVCAALLTLGALWVASGLTYSPRLDNLLPEDMPLVKEFNRVIDKTGEYRAAGGRAGGFVTETSAGSH